MLIQGDKFFHYIKTSQWVTDIKTSQWVTEKGHKGFLEAICLLNVSTDLWRQKSLIRKMSNFLEKAYAGIGLHLISSKRGMKTMMINSSLFWSLAIFQFVFTWWERRKVMLLLWSWVFSHECWISLHRMCVKLRPRLLESGIPLAACPWWSCNHFSQENVLIHPSPFSVAQEIETNFYFN